MAKNFWGDILTGALAVDQQMNADQRAAIEKQDADQRQYQFNKQKEFDQTMSDIADQEDSAEKTQQGVQQFVDSGDATDALVKQAENAYKQNTGDDVTPELHDQLTKDYSKANYAGNTSNLAQEGALAVARNNITAAEPDAPTAENGDVLSPDQSNVIRHSFGIVPDAVTKYGLDLQRVRALQKAGDWKSAKELKAAADSDASGEFVNAVLNRDAETAYHLYQQYPNGHFLRGLSFDDKGNMIMQNEVDGRTQVIPQYDAIAGALARMSPEKAAAMMTSKMHDEDMMQRVMANLDQRDSAQAQRIAAQMAELQARLGAKVGGNGAGGAHNGAGNGDFNADGSMKYDTFIKSLSDENGKPMKSALDTYSLYMNLRQQNPDSAKNPAGEYELAALAQQYANGLVKSSPELMPDGTFAQVVRNKNGLAYKFQSNIDPTSVKGADGNPMLTPAAALDTIKKSMPQQFADAQKTLAAPSGIANLQRFVADPKVSQQDRAAAQQLINVASQIKRFTAPGPQANASQPNGGTQPQRFTADEQQRMTQLGITPNQSITSMIGDKIDSIAGALADNQLSADDSQFQYDLQRLRAGSTNSFAAKRLQNMLADRPSLAKQYGITQDEMLKIKAYNPQ